MQTLKGKPRRRTCRGRFSVFRGCAALMALAAISLPAAGQSIDAAKLAELQRIIANQQKMIEAQARTLGALKTRVDALQARSLATGKKVAKAVEQAERTAGPAKTVGSGNDNVKLTLSGQVSRVSFIADDGTESNIFHSDNENSSTRWRLVGSAKLSDDFAIGAKIEQDIGQTNNSSSVDIDQRTSASDVAFDNRHLTFYLDSKQFGRVWLGKGDTSSNNITQVDLSGTSVIEYSGLEDVGGGLKFRTAGVVTPDGPKVSGGSDATGSGVYSQFDGLSRRNRIQYDTPTIAGFKAGVTHVQGDAWDASLRYSAHYDAVGLKVAAGIAYWN